MNDHSHFSVAGNKRARRAGLALALVLALLGGNCRQAPDPIRLGFIGSIKAFSGDHDRGGRDGALLAVAEVNAAGGIDGHPLELMVLDDEFSPERATADVHELVRKGAFAIVGPMTSRMAQAVAQAADEDKVVVISPTATTEALAGKDDYFFRVYPQTSVGAKALAAHFFNLNIRLAHVIKDVTNLAHTGEFESAFFRTFAELGGTAGESVDFDPHLESSLSDVVQRLPIATDDPEVIIILSTPPNVGLLAQVLRRRVDYRLIGSSEWAANSSLIAFGGAAVEGLRMAKVFNDSDREGKTAAFRTAFLARFFYEPNFSAACSYEAVKTIASVLPKVGNRVELKDALLKSGPYEGVQGYYTFDAYGDVKRPVNIMVIRDGAFALETPVREE